MWYLFFSNKLKCKKQLNADNNTFEVDLMRGAHTLGWQLCGLRMFEGGKCISLTRNTTSYEKTHTCKNMISRCTTYADGNDFQYLLARFPNLQLCIEWKEPLAGEIKSPSLI